MMKAEGDTNPREHQGQQGAVQEEKGEKGLSEKDGENRKRKGLFHPERAGTAESSREVLAVNHRNTFFGFDH